jgi:hypothetical protein
MVRGTTLLVFTALLGSGHAESIVIASVGGRAELAANQALVVFVPAKTDTAGDAIKDGALSGAQDKGVAATLVRALPIPIVGPLAGPLVGHLVNKLHPKPVTGFSVAFVKGLSASTAGAPGKISFEIPSEYLEGATPSLLRIKPSTKDSTRIVRSLRLSVKASGSSVTPDEHNTKVLGDDQDLVPSHTEVRNGNTLLIPESPLESGEYAVALVPSTQGVMMPVGKVWDFRVDTRAVPSVKPPETQTIEPGQSIAQVTVAWGSPQKIAKLGNKQIYYYKDLKVIFVNGKVTDVQ